MLHEDISESNSFCFFLLVFAGLMVFANLFKKGDLDGFILLNKTSADAPTGGSGSGNGGSEGSAGAGAGDGSGASCGSGDACVITGTPIDLPNGATKPVESITAGEKISAYSLKGMGVVSAEVVEILQHSKDDHPDLVCLKTETATLFLTRDHHVLTPAGWRAAGTLQKGDTAFVLREGVRIEEKIQEIGEKTSETSLYTIRTTEDNYFANGVLIHTEKPVVYRPQILAERAPATI